MSPILIDTSAWSRFYRSDFSDADPFVTAVSSEISTRDVATTGIIYLELLRGFTRQSTREQIRRDFEAIALIEPSREDYGHAAELSLICRRAGVQLAAIDALIAQVCIANDLTLMTADADFTHAAGHIPLDVWAPT